MSRARKGISPVIATVIIVAVAIAISVAVAGWLLGLWSSFAGGTPSITLSNAIVYDNGTIALYVTNNGPGSDKIVKIEISNGTNATPANLENSPSIIKAGFKGWIKAEFANLKVSPGDTVSIKVYFQKTGTQTIQAVVEPGKSSGKSQSSGG